MIISLEKNIVNSGSTQKTPISTDEPTSSSPSSSPRAKKNEEVSNYNIPIAPVVQPDVQVLSVKSDETTNVVKVEDVVPSITTDAAAAAAQGTPTPSSGENN